MDDAHKALVRQFVETIWNEGRFDEAQGFFADDFVDHNPVMPGLPAGVEGARLVFSTYMRAFPDLRFTVHDIIVEGDRVAWRWNSRGTHLDEFMGVPASGRQIATHGVEVYRIVSGKIAERWGSFDTAAMLIQIGWKLIPPVAAEPA
jgi:steroid delta-isomerase-like uncharacterized protein